MAGRGARCRSRSANGDSAALDGLSAALAAAVSGGDAGQDPSLVAGCLGLLRGVLCCDFAPERDYVPLGALSTVVAAEAPRFGALKFWDMGDVTACVGWRGEATNLPHRLRVAPHPNVLVTNNLHDPATPLISALAVSRCAFDAQFAFLANPASGPMITTCDM